MAQLDQGLPSTLSAKQALSTSTSSSDHLGEAAPQTDIHKSKEENVKGEQNTISPEEEEAIRKEIEKAFEARKENLIKVFLSYSLG